MMCELFLVESIIDHQKSFKLLMKWQQLNKALFLQIQTTKVLISNEKKNNNKKLFMMLKEFYKNMYTIWIRVMTGEALIFFYMSFRTPIWPKKKMKKLLFISLKRSTSFNVWSLLVSSHMLTIRFPTSPTLQLSIFGDGVTFDVTMLILLEVCHYGGNNVYGFVSIYLLVFIKIYRTFS